MELPSLIRDATRSGNWSVAASFLGPAWRGLVLRRGLEEATPLPVSYRMHFDWKYLRDHPQLGRLYEAAKQGQWNAAKDLDWSIDVDPRSEERPVLPDQFLPTYGHPSVEKLSPKEKAIQRQSAASWILSQFLHGEQGALYAACQVTEAVPWMDGKLYGSTQAMDEGRHVEVFHRYLTEKVQRLYFINDNLYVVIDALMSDGRWDMKFLGMQIMIEGLALGAFGMLRQLTTEPLLKQILTYVISDEARHVHYGVLALEEYVAQLSDRERIEREDWAFEVSLMLRNRFMARELYEEYYAHEMTPKQWDELIATSTMMSLFRRTMFKRIIPNLKRIGLLSERVRPRYAELGLLEYESGRAAPELTAQDLIEDRD